MRVILLMAACVAALTSGPLAAQDAQGDGPRSAQLVKQLISAMKARQLEAIVVADPQEAGRFVGALAFPEVQLLVVSSRPRAVDYIQSQIAKREFRDVYVVLQDALATGRLFFHDMGCDGFQTGTDNVDIFYEGNDKTTLLDGKWEAQSLTEADYVARSKYAEEKYSRALTLLLEGVKKLPITTVP